VLEALGRPVTRPVEVREPAIATNVPAAPPRRPRADIADVHGLILARLGPSPLAEDQLIRDLAVAPGLIAEELLTMELEGIITRSPGGLVSRC
jgi:DNA processing protein